MMCRDEEMAVMWGERMVVLCGRWVTILGLGRARLRVRRVGLGDEGWEGATELQTTRGGEFVSSHDDI